MSKAEPTCPLSRKQTIDTYFMEHRAKLIDVAAFLDRVDRSAGESNAGADFRIAAMERATAILIDGQPDRVKRILDVLSDPTTEPIATAGMKGADGAYPGDAVADARAAT